MEMLIDVLTQSLGPHSGYQPYHHKSAGPYNRRHHSLALTYHTFKMTCVLLNSTITKKINIWQLDPPLYGFISLYTFISTSYGLSVSVM